MWDRMSDADVAKQRKEKKACLHCGGPLPEKPSWDRESEYCGADGCQFDRADWDDREDLK